MEGGGGGSLVQVLKNPTFADLYFRLEANLPRSGSSSVVRGLELTTWEEMQLGQRNLV